MRRLKLLFVLVCIACCSAPLFKNSASSTHSTALSHPDWPTHFHGIPLSEVPLSGKETKFLRDFPGAVKKFSVGGGQLLLRFVSRPTRKLHPAKDCFKGSGYAIQYKPILKDSEGASWGCAEAMKQQTKLLVCERIVDSYGREFTDVSAWYWESLLGRSRGPWWAVTSVAAVSQQMRQNF